ncbi:MAG: adenosine deaminase [Nanoarchaeota archaeon]|nr:adenosine deaminase [Nanoarchaeota archaeon]
MPKKTKIKRAELHAHLGASVNPPILWSIAHRQGIKLPMKNYWEFENMITMSKSEKNRNLDEMHNNFYHWTELIQSSPEAVEESVQSVIGGGYRKCNLILQELRFNPMFRNRGGERDLDHIILSALWGLEKALLEYPEVKAGIILMMDRTLTFEQNSIILKKAIKYHSQGIIGLDIAGPQRKTFSLKKHAPLFRAAREAGLGVTVHTGEEGTLEEMRFVIKEIRPDRIGHGIIAHRDPKILAELAEKNITLELCPTSNLRNNKIKNIAELRRIVSAFLRHGVKFTINTDGPEMYRTNIHKEQQLLIQSKILTEKEIVRCTRWAFEATFMK